MKTWKEPVVTVQTYVPESSVSTELITNTPKPSSLVEQVKITLHECVCLTLPCQVVRGHSALPIHM